MENIYDDYKKNSNSDYVHFNSSNSCNKFIKTVKNFKLGHKCCNNTGCLVYFENYDNITSIDIIHPINYHDEHQFKNYNNLNYKCIIPLVKKYFSPSNEINEIINNIEKKYN